MRMYPIASSSSPLKRLQAAGAAAWLAMALGVVASGPSFSGKVLAQIPVADTAPANRAGAGNMPAYAALQEGLAGLVRVYAVVDEHPSIADAPDAVALPPGRGHVAFDDVRFIYPDGRTGLAGLSFEASPGTTVKATEIASPVCAIIEQGQPTPSANAKSTPIIVVVEPDSTPTPSETVSIPVPSIAAVSPGCP